MTPLAIDHMRIDVPGMAEPRARELAHLVTTGLQAASGLADGTSIPVIRLDLEAEPTGDVALLARRIVAATLSAIAHAATGAL